MQKKNQNFQKDKIVKKVKKNKYDEQKENEQIYENMSQYEFSDQSDDKSETMEEKRIRIAKDIIRKAKEQKEKEEDDFFIEEFTGVERHEDDKINEILQRDLMKKRRMNEIKVYESIKEKIQQKKAVEIELKGHKKTINKIQLDENKQNIMYTCSKDQAIICWDIEKQQKVFINKQAHSNNILCMSLNQQRNMMISSGTDRIIKLWDLNTNKLINNLKGHRGQVNDLKCCKNSNEFASISDDKTLRQWDSGEQCFIEQFYGHKDTPICLDTFGENDYVSCGIDKQAIIWQMQSNSQIIFNSNNLYALDVVSTINSHSFVTAGQEGLINIYSSQRKKPIYSHSFIDPQQQNPQWITGLCSLYNSDLILSANTSGQLFFTKFNQQQINSIETSLSIFNEGIINDIQIESNAKIIAYTITDSTKFGRWITKGKTKNRIKILSFC